MTDGMSRSRAFVMLKLEPYYKHMAHTDSCSSAILQCEKLA